MERFYFHIRVNGRFIPDEEGMMLPDMGSAIAELRASAHELLATDRLGSIEMTDASGAMLDTISASGTLH